MAIDEKQADKVYDYSISGLDSLLGHELSVEEFFTTCWETAPRVFHSRYASSPALPWRDVLGMLRAAQAPARPTEVEVLVFKDSCPTSEYPSCHAAYLDGCSIVVNHIDKIYEPVHRMCVALRQHLPHIFTNMYLTPPNEQAVAPHADDRDVLVLQVSGSKSWKVYANPPVALPLPSEQVGKSEEYPVPQTTLDETPLLSPILRAGDVLYMPRGFVHEALTSDDASLHLTFALPTHDWSWASVVSDALRAAGRTPEEVSKFGKDAVARKDCGERGNWFWRHSVPPSLVCRELASLREDALKKLAVIASEVGLHEASSITVAFEAKLAHHNARQDVVAPSSIGSSLSPCSYVRRLTAEEKASLAEMKQQQGMMARNELLEVLPRILSGISTQPVLISSFADCEALCPFGKVCFAAVCIDQGLLCVCDAHGSRMEGTFTSGWRHSDKIGSRPKRKRRGGVAPAGAKRKLRKEAIPQT